MPHDSLGLMRVACHQLEPGVHQTKALAGPPWVKAIVAEVTREEDVVRMFAEVGSFDRRCDHAVMRS